MSHADKPARIREEDSETPYTTTRAIEFMEARQKGVGERQAEGWCLHLSYIKPHWPYIVPEPYHNMYGPDDVPPVLRDEAERANPHPVLGAYHNHRFSKVFSRDDVRERVIPAYMGLITQLDDQIGRLMTYLEDSGQMDNTLIVFTSDHGDYLGDHWLGEKELFHEQSVKIPLIIVDPSKEADTTRGSVCDALIESIDLVPTFVEVAGGTPRSEILEGQSLMPYLHAEMVEQRKLVISEYDYSFRAARQMTGQAVGDCRLAMIFDGCFKLVHAEGFRPMLYDLQVDPNEFADLGDQPQMRPVIEKLEADLFAWYRKHHTRTTISDAEIAKRAGREFQRGIYIGFWDQADIDDANEKDFGGN